MTHVTTCAYPFPNKTFNPYSYLFKTTYIAHNANSSQPTKSPTIHSTTLTTDQLTNPSQSASPSTISVTFPYPTNAQTLHGGYVDVYFDERSRVLHDEQGRE